MKTCLLTSDNRALICVLRVEKGWGALRMMKEFPSRQWKHRTLNDLLKELTKLAALTERGVPRSVCTSDNTVIVDELICSQEGQPGSLLQPVQDTLSTL